MGFVDLVNNVSGGLTPSIFQPVPDVTTTNLKAAVMGARSNINEIRMLLKGNIETCQKLFKEAVKEGDAITQIQLSHALFGMKWGKDDTKDYSSLIAEALETFSYYPREFALFNSAYDQSMRVESDWKTRDIRGDETFRIAAGRGYLPAFLELKSKEWKSHTNSYGFAVQLRPFVAKGDRQLDYFFGQALKNGCQIGSELYYEGLHWMNQSLGIPVKYPRKDQSFEDFKRQYVKDECVLSTYYDHDGFRHVGGSVILAPSKEVWETFVKEKLGHVKFAPMESYQFKFDPEQIRSLLNEYKIGVLLSNSFVESSSEGREVKGFGGGKKHGFCIDSLSIYQDLNQIGEISVQEDSFKIHQTFENSNIKPIIDFIENVMTRTGSAHSAYSWLKQLGGRYI